MDSGYVVATLPPLGYVASEALTAPTLQPICRVIVRLVAGPCRGNERERSGNTWRSRGPGEMETPNC